MHRIVPTKSIRAFLLAATCCVLLGLAAALVLATDATETHVVRDGDTLATIAAEHGITVKGLLALNPEVAAAEVVHVGAVLRVPGPLASETVPDVACPAEYIVQEGDTWVSIGEVHAVAADILARVNRRDPDLEPVAGTNLCLPLVPAEVREAATMPPAANMECEDEIQYILQGPRPATFVYSTEALAPGLQVCVLTSLEVVAGFWILRVATETGATDWISSRHVGSWPAYLASTDPSLATPTATPRPTRTPRPTATPRPTRTPTPTVAPCRDAWGASVVAYRVRRGPGTQHAHTGRYVAAGEPVCELRRDQGWVQVRLADDTTGWVHADGITNREPTPTPISPPTPVPTPTSAIPPTPTAVPQPPVAPVPATTTSSGIVVRSHNYGYAIDMPPGWTKVSSRVFDEEWEGEGALRIRSYNQPAGTTLDQFARWVRDTALQDWWENPSLFEITAFEKRQVGGQDWYVLKYRVQESPQYCILDVEEVLGLGPSRAGPARGFRAQHRMCDWEGFDRTRRQVLDSLRVVTTPSYYTQFLNFRGIWIKAPGEVESQALHVAADTLDRMLDNIRRGIPECLAASGADLAIIPKDSYVTALPEFAYLKGKRDRTGRPYEGFALRGLGGVPGQPVSATSEENLLGLAGDSHAFIDVTIHEYAHAIQNLCFTPAEQAAIEALFGNTKRLGRFDGAYAMTIVDEFFAIFTTAYFDATRELSDYGIPRRGGREALRQRVPEIYKFMERIYDSR